MADAKVLIKAIERLDHRVTLGDVAAEAGLPLHEAQQGLLALASDVQAHLQVSEAGEIAYVFPKNIQGILLSKSWKLRWQATWEKTWRILFYLIRISFGVILILSLVIMVLAMIALSIAAAAAQQNDNNRDSRSGGGMIFIPRMWFGPDLFRMFDYRSSQRPPAKPTTDAKMNFLEAVFSFLFGDGNPNADLEERRWQAMATVVKANGGVVVAEQMAPFLGDLGQGWSQEFEDFMIPVLSRFNGVPQVSPEGGIVYQFPDLQITAQERKTVSPPRFLQEQPRQFSRASAGQIMGAIALGSANLIAALALGSMLQDNQALVYELGGLVALVNSLYWLLLAYGSAFMGIPIVRYFWVQRQNGHILRRNQGREQRAQVLAQLDAPLREKISFAKTLAGQTIVAAEDLAYTTETDLTDQEIANRDKIDEEWQKLLEQRKSS
ncbi:MAG: hypothetical protein VKI82_06360 [Leptolyngbya sp.]|nr:hypothetical protein [Leptolyngbya sp.]